MTTSPALIVTGLALKVPACAISAPPFVGSNKSIMSLRPPKAPTGIPPPIILPKAVISGTTPNNSCAPPGATLKL